MGAERGHKAACHSDQADPETARRLQKDGEATVAAAEPSH
jgi:hypothetical protein